MKPSSQPSMQPSRQPTTQPTCQPSSRPTHPTPVPSYKYKFPTKKPTYLPSSSPSSQPTGDPSQAPSAQPSMQPSSAPTFVSFSIIKSMNVSLSKSSPKSSIVVSVEVEKRNAMVYCGAISNSSTEEPSIEDILFQFFSTYTDSLFGQIEIYDLAPSTAYSFYCLTKSDRDVYMSTAMMLQTRKCVSTACCKEVIVQIDDTYAYENSASLGGITIELTYAPSFNLIVHLATLDNHTSFDNESLPYFFPSILIYSSVLTTSKTLVNWISQKSGLYRVNATLTGISAGEFSVTYKNMHTLSVIGLNEEPNTPELQLNASYSADGTFVTLSFNSKTDRGGYGSNFVCSALLNFVAASSSTCLWSSSLEINIFSSTTTPLPIGGRITLRGSKIRAACTANNCTSWAYVATANATIRAPDSPVRPKVSIMGPSVVGICDNVRLDVSGSSGSGGRKWSSVEVTVVSTTVGTTALQRFLSSENYTYDPPTSINSDYFDAGGAYVFFFKMCNFFEACNLASHSISVVTVSTLIPTVSISGAKTRSIFNKDGLRLKAVGSLSKCDGSLTYMGLSYSWTLSDSTGATVNTIENEAKQESNFKISPYKLTPYTYYSVKVAVSSGGSTSTSTISVYVKSSFVEAVIRGGLKKVIRLNEDPVQIDASGSFDTNTGSSAGLNFTWSCFQIKPAFSKTCALTVNSSTIRSDILTVYSTNASHINSTSRITVLVYDSTRSSTAFVDVSIGSVSTPVISIDSTLLKSIDTAEKFALSGSISLNSPCVATWAVSGDSIDLTAASLVPTTLSLIPGATRTTNLVLGYDYLYTMATYTFSLSCGSSTASVVVTTNGPPLPGQFDVSPSSGTELSTRFLFSARFWADSDLPISYQFGFLPPTDNMSYLITQFVSETSYSSTWLPAGSSSEGFALTCFARIFDSHNAYADSLTSILVQAASLSTSSLSNLLTNQLYNATGSFDSIQQVVSTAAALLNRVNCTVPRECTTLNRYECKETSYTCGECLLDYIGDNYDSNTLCYLKSALSNSSKILKTCDDISCSGHGTCAYYNSGTYTAVESCFVSEFNCEARCLCDSAYGGAVCGEMVIELEARQDIRSKLIDVLFELVQGAEESSPNLLSLSTNLESLTKNSYELNDNCASSAINMSSSILAKIATMDIDFSSSTASNVLSAFDKSVTSLSKASQTQSRRLITSDISSLSNTTGVLVVSFLSSYADLVATQMYEGESADQVMTAHYRVFTKTFAATASNLSLSLPSTAYESAVGAEVSSVFLTAPIASNSTLTVSIFETKSTLFDSLLNDFTSSLFSVQIYESNSILPTTQNVTFRLSHFYSVNHSLLVSAHSFTSKCSVGTAELHTHICPDSKQIIWHNCSGSKNVVLRSQCPLVKPFDVCETLTLTGSSTEQCTTLSYSSSHVTCTCLLQSGGERSTRRLEDTFIAREKQFSVDVISAIILTPSGSTTTEEFESSVDFSGENNGQVFVVVAIFCVVWAAGMLAVFFTSAIKAKGLKKIGFDKKDRPTKNRLSIENAREKFYDYIIATLPSVFRPNKTIFRLVQEEVLKRHMFYHLLSKLNHDTSDIVRISSTVHLLTFQSALLFLLTFFMDLNLPSYDGSCATKSAETACAERTTYFDSTQKYCSWNEGAGNCSYNDASPSWLTIFVMSILVSECCVCIMTPLNILFGLINAPDDVKVNQLAGSLRQQRMGSKPNAKYGGSLTSFFITDEVDSSKRVMLESFAELKERISIRTSDEVSNKSLDEDASIVIREPSCTNFASSIHVRQNSIGAKTAAIKDNAQMTKFFQGISMQRSLIKDDVTALEAFDAAWGIDTYMTNHDHHDLGLIFLREIPHPRRRCFNYRDTFDIEEILRSELNRINDDSVSLVRSLKTLGEDEVGLEVVHTFVSDVLGRDSFAAKIFRGKALEDSTCLKATSTKVKVLAWSLILMVNIFFLFYIYTYSFSKGFTWQIGILYSVLYQIFLEVVVNETTHVLWRHCLIPFLVMDEFKRVNDVISSTVYSFFHSIKHEYSTANPFDSVAYSFVSKHLSRHFPDLPESMMVQHYQSNLPDPNLARRLGHFINPHEIVVGRKNSIDALYRALVYIPLLIGTLPSAMQKFIIRLMQPIGGLLTVSAFLLILIHQSLFCYRKKYVVRDFRARRSATTSNEQNSIAVHMGLQTLSSESSDSLTSQYSHGSSDDDIFVIPLRAVNVNRSTSTFVIPSTIDAVDWLDKLKEKKKQIKSRIDSCNTVISESKHESKALDDTDRQKRDNNSNTHSTSDNSSSVDYQDDYDDYSDSSDSADFIGHTAAAANQTPVASIRVVPKRERITDNFVLPKVHHQKMSQKVSGSDANAIKVKVGHEEVLSHNVVMGSSKIPELEPMDPTDWLKRVVSKKHFTDTSEGKRSELHRPVMKTTIENDRGEEKKTDVLDWLKVLAVQKRNVMEEARDSKAKVSTRSQVLASIMGDQYLRRSGRFGLSVAPIPNNDESDDSEDLNLSYEMEAPNKKTPDSMKAPKTKSTHPKSTEMSVNASLSLQAHSTDEKTVTRKESYSPLDPKSWLEKSVHEHDIKTYPKSSILHASQYVIKSVTTEERVEDTCVLEDPLRWLKDIVVTRKKEREERGERETEMQKNESVGPAPMKRTITRPKTTIVDRVDLSSSPLSDSSDDSI